MNHHAFVTGEHGRMIACLAMIGTVNQLDEQSARVTVDVDDMTTDWIPWGARRAAGDIDWWAPEPGEQVLVVSPYGDPSQGVVVCSIFQDAHPTPANVKTIWRKKFADGSTVSYDREAHALTVDAGTGTVTVNCSTATVNAAESVQLDTPQVVASDNLSVGNGATGSFSTPTGLVVSVKDGIVTNIF